MKRLLLDLNVVLDVLLDRTPNVEPAAALWKEIEGKRAVGYLAAHGFTTIHYLARKARSLQFAGQAVADLLSVFRVAPVNKEVLQRAVALSFPDFEDAVCAACASLTECDLLITRDPKGFRGSPVTAMDPASAVAWLRTAQE